MTSYLIRLIRRARGDASAMLPAALDDLPGIAEEEVAMPQQPAALADHPSPQVLPAGQPTIPDAGRRDAPAPEPGRRIAPVRRFEYAPQPLDRRKGQAGRDIINNAVLTTVGDRRRPAPNSRNAASTRQRPF
jgi:hypothetical protein